MKKFTSLLIGVSLTLAGAALAQNPEESPAAGGKKQGNQKTEQAEPKAPKTRGEKPAKPEATTAKQTGAMNEQGATGEQGAGKGHKAKAANATGTETNVSGQTTGAATTETGAGKGRRAKAEKSANAPGTETNVSGQTTGGATTTETGAGKGKRGHAKTDATTATGAAGTNASAEASASVAPGGKGQAGMRGQKGMKGAGANAKATAAPSATPVTAASATAAPIVAASVSAAGQQNTTATGGNVKADPQKVQQVKQKVEQIKQQHVSFKAQSRPDKVPPVTFSVNYRIQGSDRWQGAQYEVFRSYHPERHERNWYHSHFTRIELIGGGYYYWNNGYWFPAWGYDSGAEYYAYDAPIYVGHHALPPDRVIADVQAELQEMGYYQGEVDGLLGPLTREALISYQADQGLTPTAVIDEPTLDSLGMS